MKNDIKIVVIEDEEDILELIEYHLNKEGYLVTGFLSTQKVEQFIEEESPSLMLVDRNLSGVEGSEFVAYLRRTGYNIPVIFLTAKTKEIELEEGFNAGGDDYICKPFSTKELTLRVKALLRRSGELNPSMQLKHKSLRMDTNKQSVFVSDRLIVTTKLEFRLLYVFMKHIDELLTRDFLRDEVWGGEEKDVNDNTVNVAINRLKNKIDPLHEQNYFHPVWGEGYRFS